MQRISVADAERDFSKIVDLVCSEGISVEVERGDRVVARISPAEPRSPLKVADLNAFFAGLPKLGDDAEAFSKDVRDIRREFPTEIS